MAAILSREDELKHLKTMGHDRQPVDLSINGGLLFSQRWRYI